MEEMIKEAQEVADMLIKAKGYHEALLYVQTHPTETFEESLVATAVRSAIVYKMKRALAN
jgi:hypothetical protein